MAVQIEVREFNLGTATGNIDLGGFSFQPKACLFLLTGNASQNADSASGDGMRLAWGLCDGTRQWAMCSGEENAQTTSDVGRRSTTSGCILWADEGGGSQVVQGKASFVSFLTDGVRVNRLTAFSSPGSPLVKVIAFGGTDVSVFGDLVAPSTSLGGTVNVTPGFEADVVLAFMIGNHVDADGNAENDDHSLSMGWAVNPDRQAANNQFCIGFGSQDAQTGSQNDMAWFNNRCAVSRQDNAVDPGAEITAFGATTFTVTTRDEAALAADRVGFLALNLGGANAKVFSVAQDMPTATGPQSQAGASFTPLFLLGLAIGDDRAANTWAATDADNSSVGVGLTDGTRTFAATAWTDDAVTSACRCRIRNTHVWSLDNQAGALEDEATLTSFNADGWTLNFTTAASPAKRTVYLAIGDAATGGAADGDLSAAGIGTMTATGASLASGGFSFQGTGSMTMAGASLAASAMTSTGISTAEFDGRSAIAAAMFSSGEATMTMAASAIASGALDAQGQGDFTLEGSALATGALDAQGAGELTAEGAALASGAVTSTGTSTVEWVGASVSEAAGAFSMAGESTVEWVGESTATATFASDGTGAASFEGVGGEEPEPAPTPARVPDVGGGAWPRPNYIKARRKKKLLEEDEELIAVLKQAAPYLLQGRRRLH